jgi:hypothetical protein
LLGFHFRGVEPLDELEHPIAQRGIGCLPQSLSGSENKGDQAKAWED